MVTTPGGGAVSQLGKLWFRCFASNAEPLVLEDCRLKASTQREGLPGRLPWRPRRLSEGLPVAVQVFAVTLRAARNASYPLLSDTVHLPQLFSQN